MGGPQCAKRGCFGRFSPFLPFLLFSSLLVKTGRNRPTVQREEGSPTVKREERRALCTSGSLSFSQREESTMRLMVTILPKRGEHYAPQGSFSQREESTMRLIVPLPKERRALCASLLTFLPKRRALCASLLTFFPKKREHSAQRFNSKIRREESTLRRGLTLRLGEEERPLRRGLTLRLGEKGEASAQRFNSRIREKRGLYASHCLSSSLLGSREPLLPKTGLNLSHS